MSILGSDYESSWVRRWVGATLMLSSEGKRVREANHQLVSGLKPDSLLDVGCGNGAWSLECIRRLNIPIGNIFGIEVHSDLIQEAIGKIKLFEVDLEAEKIPLSDQSVQLANVNQVLEHLKNVFYCLSEMERVLKVGGHLSIGIPNLGGLVNRFYLLLGRQPMCHEFPGPHVRAFTHRAFLDFIRLNPAFQLVRCIGSSLYPFPPPLLEAGARAIPGWSAYTFYLLEKLEHRGRSVWLEEAAKIGATNFRT